MCCGHADILNLSSRRQENYHLMGNTGNGNICDMPQRSPQFSCPRVICLRFLWNIRAPFPNLYYVNHNVDEIRFIWTASLRKSSIINPSLPLRLCRLLGLIAGLQKFRSERLSQHQCIRYIGKSSSILALV